MFWEIDDSQHKKSFDIIVNYIFNIFKFAELSKKDFFDCEEWKKYADKDADWFINLYKKNSDNGKEMRHSINKLFEKSISERKKIQEALRHDLDFNDNLGNPFIFEVPKLSADVKKIIRDIFLYFYGVVLCTAKFELEGLKIGGVSREDFVNFYFQGKNRILRNVCPVCLQKTIDGMEEHDVEHFFPKSIFPALVLHPNNIYFICQACNQRYKSTRNPIENFSSNIQTTFIPYFDTVRDKVEIVFEHKTECDSIKLVPIDKSEKYIDDKIASFNKLFDLERRWSKTLEQYYVEWNAVYEEEENLSYKDLAIFMEVDLKRKKRILLKNPGEYVSVKYLEWIQTSDVQLKAFYSNLKQEGFNPTIVD